MSSKFIWAFGLIMATANCSRTVGEEELKAYIRDPTNGLTQYAWLGTDTLVCSYRPTDLLLVMERHTAKSALKLAQQYAGKTYFTLSLRHQGAEIENQFITDPLTYSQAINYLSSGIAQDVYLAAGPDSVPALAASYPRQYGTTGRSTVLLVFTTQHLDLRRDFTVTWHDRLFGLGTVRFTFDGDDLADLPELTP